MSNRSDLLQQLNRLKRDERALKNEEFEIRRVKAVKDQREPLAQNHEKRMKNKRQQGLLTIEIRKQDVPTPSAAGPTIAPVTGSQPHPLPPTPPAPPFLPEHGDPIGP